MIEFWKVKREVLRVWYKVSDGLLYPFEKLAQNKYDRNFEKLSKQTIGHISPDGKIALFFIYQPHEFSKSVSLTCEYLRQQGYAVLLISSGRITDSDKAKLSENCWKIVERPNFGYDFGGYRDGLRIIREANLTPERLLILNDSIWFPIFQNTSLLTKLENAGLSFNSPVFVNIPERRRENRHFQSFFFLIRKEALESPAFIDYWKKYHVSSKKRIVLKQGEKGFSQAMFKGGFGGDAPATKLVLFRMLENQKNEFLSRTLSYAAYADAKLADEGRSLLKDYTDSDRWRRLALDHMQRALAVSSPIGVFVYASTSLLDFSFLKKRSFASVFDGMRWQYVRAVKNGDLPSPHPDVLAEIMASPMDGSLTTDPSIPAPNSATKVV